MVNKYLVVQKDKRVSVGSGCSGKAPEKKSLEEVKSEDILAWVIEK